MCTTPSDLEAKSWAMNCHRHRKNRSSSFDGSRKCLTKVSHCRKHVTILGLPCSDKASWDLVIWNIQCDDLSIAL